MEDRQEDALQEEQERHVPRPKWQIALAWVGLVIMIVCIVLYYFHIAKGGMF